MQKPTKSDPKGTPRQIASEPTAGVASAAEAVGVARVLNDRAIAIAANEVAIFLDIADIAKILVGVNSSHR
ncbi:hypothetical protein BFN03_14375 [Rhodococcus sp. WMMA185]|nr:hypothetical protein BFN03_14375 [Rhodococcus sp. WMMA185]